MADRLKVDFALIHRDNSKQQQHQTSPARKLNVPGTAISTSSSMDSFATHLSAMTLDSSHRRQRTWSIYNQDPDDDDEDDEIARSNTDTKSETADTDLVLVGDVKDRVTFILDDIIDSTKSFIESAKFLVRKGARKVYVVATHGILSEMALAEIEQCQAVTGVIITNTYALDPTKRQQCSKLHIIDISGVLAEAIRRTHNGESISYLFDTVV
jgi:ribose-phosphate pyrophosphokinase